jgi:nucleotide-binding universal stress UspA family protein
MPIETLCVAVRTVENQQPLVDAVIDVAGPTDASVVLAKAFEEDGYEERVKRLDFENQPTTDEVARRSRTIRNMAADLDNADIEYEIRGIVGEEGDAFVNLAKSVNSDLLYVQGQDRSPTGKALFGSTAQKVLLNAPCPVTYVQS